MALPKFLQPCLASYDLFKMDSNESKETIITSVLNKGNDKAMKWLCETYSAREIKGVLRNPMRGMWLKRTLDYWQKIFDIKIPKFTYKLALLSLEPRPKLYEKFFKINVPLKSPKQKSA